MLKAVVFLAVLVAVNAQCDRLQQIKLKSQWAQAYSEGLSREDFGQAIWRAVFAKSPESRALFSRVRGDNTLSPEFQAHSMRVLGGLDMLFSLLDSPAVFDEAAAHLNTQHDEREIPGHYFATLGDAITATAHASIGYCFDEDAWSNCFQKVVSGIVA